MGQMQLLGKTATKVYRTLYETGTTVTVRYHNTDVVNVYRDGRIKLNSGGWRTATTKNRMNQASNQFGLGYRVYQIDFKWFVDCPDGVARPFWDGMILDPATKPS